VESSYSLAGTTTVNPSYRKCQASTKGKKRKNLVPGWLQMQVYSNFSLEFWCQAGTKYKITVFTKCKIMIFESYLNPKMIAQVVPGWY